MSTFRSSNLLLPSAPARDTLPSMSTKWSDRNYVRAYMLALDGLPDCQIAEALGVSAVCISKWKADNKAFAWGLEVARRKAGNTLADFVYDSLPTDLREVWEELCMANKARDSFERVRDLFSRHGENVRKHMFVFAYLKKDMNENYACRFVGIPYHTYEQWLKDKEFKSLMDRMPKIRGDYFESQLTKLVGHGDAGVTIFANKTYNAARGYGDVSKIELKTPNVPNEEPVTLTQGMLKYATPEERRHLAKAGWILRELRKRQEEDGTAPDTTTGPERLRAPEPGHYVQAPQGPADPVPRLPDLQQEGGPGAGVGEGRGDLPPERDTADVGDGRTE